MSQVNLRILYTITAIILIAVGLFILKVLYPQNIYPVFIARYYSDTTTVLNYNNTVIFNNEDSYIFLVNNTILQDYSKILNREHFDFQQYTYVISIGDSINYLVEIDDDCPYMKGQAVIPQLSNKKSKYLYIFRLPKSPIYREQCG